MTEVPREGAPDVEHRRAIVDFAELARVLVVVPGVDLDAVLVELCHLVVEVDTIASADAGRD